MYLLNRRTLRAMGSVMEFWPQHTYAEYMPKGSIQQRLGRYWNTTGNHLDHAVSSRESRSPDGLYIY